MQKEKKKKRKKKKKKEKKKKGNPCSNPREQHGESVVDRWWPRPSEPNAKHSRGGNNYSRNARGAISISLAHFSLMLNR